VNGNISSKTVDGVVTNYSVNAANELTNTGYSFDANGDQTASPANSFAYNAKRQTQTISGESMSYRGPGQSLRVGAGLSSFRYNQTGLSVRTDTAPRAHATGAVVDSRRA
jgi:hemolysin activation/secretion protein